MLCRSAAGARHPSLSRAARARALAATQTRLSQWVLLGACQCRSTLAVVERLCGAQGRSQSSSETRGSVTSGAQTACASLSTAAGDLPLPPRTVSERIALAVVWPMPYTYCSENSIIFLFGISTPPTRAACILRGVRCAAACKSRSHMSRTLNHAEHARGRSQRTPAPARQQHTSTGLSPADTKQ